MRIGIDIDDTITSSYNIIMDIVGKVYNKDMSYYIENGTSYYDLINDNVNFPNYRNSIKKFQEEQIPNVPLKKNAKDIINKLKKDGHEIYFITARSSDEYKNPYLISYLYLIKHDISFDKLAVNIQNKGLYCSENKIDIFIDDSVVNCLSTVNYGIETYIFDNTFNRNNNNFNRVNNWIEVYDIIKEKNNC